MRNGGVGVLVADVPVEKPSGRLSPRPRIPPVPWPSCTLGLGSSRLAFPELDGTWPHYEIERWTTLGGNIRCWSCRPEP
jgi:hypothetical protein